MKFLIAVLLISPFIWVGYIFYIGLTTNCRPKHMYHTNREYIECIKYWKEKRDNDIKDEE